MGPALLPGAPSSRRDGVRGETLLKASFSGGQGPPSSGPGCRTLGACASLQLGAQALTAPPAAQPLGPLLGAGAPFFQGPGLLLSPYLRWYSPHPAPLL